MRTIFLRAVEADDKAAALLEAIHRPDAAIGHTRFEVDPVSFGKIPRSPFAYWVSEAVRATFTHLPTFETEGRTAKQGLATADDFRFVRLWTEVSPRAIGTHWFPLAKGGAYSPYYADILTVLDWAENGSNVFGYPKSVVRNPGYFFRPGLTWPLRTTSGLGLRIMSKGCIFSHKGPAAFNQRDEPAGLLALAGITNSKAFGVLVALQLAATDTAARSYEVGVIQRTPVPQLALPDRDRLAALARRAWFLKRRLDTRIETSHVFHLPALMQVAGTTLSERVQAWNALVKDSEAQLAGIQAGIDDVCFKLYRIAGEDRRRIERGFRRPLDTDESEDESEDADPLGAGAQSVVASLLSWLVGVAFGRFDVRLVTTERKASGVPVPFDPLPAYSPGMLTGEDGLPIREPPAGYPIAFPPHGILVDDPGCGSGQPHRDDIVRRMREVLDLLWKDGAQTTEQEVCEILGAVGLRDYFRRPSAFFQHHLMRYSKSRRKAPIYWPLSTASGSYTIWLYNDRLTDQTLYGAVNKYIEPKISEVQRVAANIEKELETASGRKATQLRDRLDEANKLVGELRDLHKELLGIAALPYKPNLNDGVIINAAPLHKLFRLRSWAKDTEKVWEKLENGDYDWAHLACTIWPERVKDACRKDRSIAIAHGLEDLCEVPPPAPRRRRKKRGRAQKEAGR